MSEGEVTISLSIERRHAVQIRNGIPVPISVEEALEILSNSIKEK